MTLRNANKTQQQQLETRQTQFYMDHIKFILSEPFNSNYTEMMQWEWTDYDDFVNKYGVPLPPITSDLEGKYIKKFGDVFGYYEGLGALVKNRNINVEMFGRMGGIESIWTKFEGVVYEARKRYSRPYIWQEFEILALSIQEFYSSTSIFEDEREELFKRRKELGLTQYI